MVIFHHVHVVSNCLGPDPSPSSYKQRDLRKSWLLQASVSSSMTFMKKQAPLYIFK